MENFGFPKILQLDNGEEFSKKFFINIGKIKILS